MNRGEGLLEGDKFRCLDIIHKLRKNPEWGWEVDEVLHNIIYGGGGRGQETFLSNFEEF